MIEHNIGSYLLISLVAFGITYMLMPTVREFAVRRAWLDQPDGVRKLHAGGIPRIGGLAMWFGVLGGLALAFLLSFAFDPMQVGAAGHLSRLGVMSLMVGVTAIAVTGLYDDVYELRAGYKLAAQIMATLPVLFCTELVDAVVILLGGGLFAEVAVYPLIMVWVIFMMNAFNLIDGMDGLAGGVGLLALLFMILIGGIQGSLLLVVLAVCGAIAAFLRYNLPPAKVFMGDMGSLLIGYLLAVLALIVLSADPTVSRGLGLVVLLGLPALDTVMAFVRRLAQGRDPFAPDRDHLHHRVLGRTFGYQPRAVVMFYLAMLLLGFFAVVIARSDAAQAVLLSGLVAGLGVLMLWELRYFDRDSYRESTIAPILRTRHTERRVVRRPRSKPQSPVREPIKHHAPTP